jgi:hypothetical protein
MTDMTQLVLEAARLMQSLDDLAATADILGEVVNYYRYRDAAYRAKVRYARRHQRLIDERGRA